MLCLSKVGAHKAPAAKQPFPIWLLCTKENSLSAQAAVPLLPLVPMPCLLGKSILCGQQGIVGKA